VRVISRYVICDLPCIGSSFRNGAISSHEKLFGGRLWESLHGVGLGPCADDRAEMLVSR
jgi:hypothetical protein